MGQLCHGRGDRVARDVAAGAGLAGPLEQDEGNRAGARTLLVARRSGHHRGGVGVQAGGEPPGGEQFPHLYGPLDPAAVVAVLPLEPGPDGAFSLPPQLA
jgi:hypothetical protein